MNKLINEFDKYNYIYTIFDHHYDIGFYSIIKPSFSVAAYSSYYKSLKLYDNDLRIILDFSSSESKTEFRQYIEEKFKSKIYGIY